MASSAAKKWYVVWHGHNPGVYESWSEAGAQVQGVPQAKYKSFATRSEADAAFAEHHSEHIGSGSPGIRKRVLRTLPPEVLLPSIAVDAACNMTTGVMEYRGVDIDSGAELFRMGPFNDSSNNMGEFLALVHALGMCKQQSLSLPIYSDSRTALAWVRKKKAKTTVAMTPGNAAVFALIARAEQWLANNSYQNSILKWNTEMWGENPADFGRK